MLSFRRTVALMRLNDRFISRYSIYARCFSSAEQHCCLPSFCHVFIAGHLSTSGYAQFSCSDSLFSMQYQIWSSLYNTATKACLTVHSSNLLLDLIGNICKLFYTVRFCIKVRRCSSPN